MLELMHPSRNKQINDMKNDIHHQLPLNRRRRRATKFSLENIQMFRILSILHNKRQETKCLFTHPDQNNFLVNNIKLFLSVQISNKYFLLRRDYSIY